MRGQVTVRGHSMVQAMSGDGALVTQHGARGGLRESRGSRGVSSVTSAAIAAPASTLDRTAQGPLRHAHVSCLPPALTTNPVGALGSPTSDAVVQYRLSHFRYVPDAPGRTTTASHLEQKHG